jgi:hypothetical protein
VEGSSKVTIKQRAQNDAPRATMSRQGAGENEKGARESEKGAEKAKREI